MPPQEEIFAIDIMGHYVDIMGHYLDIMGYDGTLKNFIMQARQEIFRNNGTRWDINQLYYADIMGP